MIVMLGLCAWILLRVLSVSAPVDSLAMAGCVLVSILANMHAHYTVS